MRPAILDFFRARLLRSLIIWALALALPLTSMSSTIAHLVGASHRHATASQAPDGSPYWNIRALARSIIGDEALAVIDAYHEHEHAHEPALQTMPMSMPSTEHGASPPHDHHHGHQGHEHAHDLFERHVHDPADGSVMALGAKDSRLDAPPSSGHLDTGSACLPPIVAMAQRPPLNLLTSAWHRAKATAWRSHVNAPLERPPRS